MAGGPPTKIKEVLATQGLAKLCTSRNLNFQKHQTGSVFAVDLEHGAAGRETVQATCRYIQFRKSSTCPETYAMSK